VLIRFWGTRGSIPSPGPDTARYGGNTPCLEIVSDGGRRIILDAGTGARMLGSRIVNESPSGSTPQSLHVFLTHCHWDHVQGLPFFEPLRTDGLQVNFRLPAHMLTQSARILETQLDPLFFPIALEDLRARIVIEAAHEREEIEDLTVRSAPVEHPGGALAYRVCAGADEGRSVVFAPDSEITRKRRKGSPLEKLITGSKILIHDAMYTEADYVKRGGWGHSTHLAALDLALRTQVQLLVLFHHEPNRTDQQVSEMVEECRTEAAKKSKELLVLGAYEGLELEL
jgi:phosphoribosyl 1,2-cyclic phosphodiesterase